MQFASPAFWPMLGDLDGVNAGVSQLDAMQSWWNLASRSDCASSRYQHAGGGRYNPANLAVEATTHHDWRRSAASLLGEYQQQASVAEQRYIEHLAAAGAAQAAAEVASAEATAARVVAEVCAIAGDWAGAAVAEGVALQADDAAEAAAKEAARQRRLAALAAAWMEQATSTAQFGDEATSEVEDRLAPLNAAAAAAGDDSADDKCYHG
jgi:uncharacterized damage-inducible protein DinB